MKKQIYNDLRTLLCALSTTLLVTGCAKNNVYDESKQININKGTTQMNIVEENTSHAIVEKEVEQENTTIIESTVANEIESKESKDEKIIKYINDLSVTIDSGVEVVNDKTKSGFITLVDFLFYDGKIADITFRELSDNAKGKVVELTSNLIQKLDNKYPEFRSSISEKYQDASTFLVEKKDILVDKIKNKLGDEKVNSISEYYESTKNNISDVYDKGKEKVKNWYENFRDKNSDTVS